MSICNQNELKSLTINRASARAMSTRNSRIRAGNPTRVNISENDVIGAGWATTRPKRFSGSLHASKMKIPRVATALLFITAFFHSVALVRAALSIGGVFSTDACYEALQDSKGDDDRLDKDEYVQFVNTLSDNFFTAFQSVDGEWGFFPVNDFYTFPKDIQDNFWKLACGGSGGNLNICSEAYIYTAGSADSDSPTDQESSHLFQVCKGTEEAIDAAMPTPPTGSNVFSTRPPIGSSTLSTSTSPTLPSPLPTTSPTAPSFSSTSFPTSSIGPPNTGVYSGPLTLTLQYQIPAGENITAMSIQNIFSPLRDDLTTAMNSWLKGILERDFQGGRRILRGDIRDKRSAKRNSLLRGGATAEVGRKLLVAIVEGSNIISASDADCNAAATTFNKSENCLHITHNVTLNLIDEKDPEGVRNHITSTFNDAIADGTFYALVTFMSLDDIDAFTFPTPSPSEFEVAGFRSPPAPSVASHPTSSDLKDSNGVELLQNILGTKSSDDGNRGGTSNNAVGIAAGITVACVVAVVGFFVIRRKKLTSSVEKTNEKTSKKEVMLDTLDENDKSDVLKPFQKSKKQELESNGVDSGKPNPFEKESNKSSLSGSSSNESSSGFSSGSGSGSGSGSSSSDGSSSDSESCSSSSSSELSKALSVPFHGPQTDVLNGSGRNNTVGATADVDVSSSIHSKADSDGKSKKKFKLKTAVIVNRAFSTSKDANQGDERAETSTPATEFSSSTNEGMHCSMLFDGMSDSDESMDDASLQDEVLRTMEKEIEENLSDSDSESDSSANEINDVSRRHSMSYDRINSNINLMSSIADHEFSQSVLSSEDNDSSHSDNSLVPFSQRPTFNTSVVMMSINEDTQDESVCRSVLTDTSTSTADIQRAIEYGDWKAVETASAALTSFPKLDAMGDMDDCSASTTSSDAQRAAEIDLMVKDGNWEGVSAAALKYAEESTSSQSSDSVSGESSRSLDDQRSDAIDNELRFSEEIPYRAEIEALVLKVIPDESNNIDDIMIQFSGREEELIETLRAMQKYHSN